MTNYTKTTDFAAKDSLPSGDSGKIIRGTEFETEFDNIATAVNSKSDANNPTFTGTVTIDGLTVNGNTVLGNAATDTVTVTADIASNLLPSADDTYNLGAVGAEWNDLFIDGVANIDSLVAGSGSFTGDVSFGDNDKALFGAGSDLQIYHDGSHSYIDDSGTGDLRIRGTNLSLRSKATNERFLDGVENGEVTVYHNNLPKLATTATGIDVTGNVSLPDDGKAVFGVGSDLQIYHSGTHSYITDTGAGNLYLGGSDLIWIGAGDLSETYATFNDDGAVTLRHDNSQKLATTSTGINVTGTAVADGLTVQTAQGNIAIPTSTSALDFDRAGTSYLRATDATGNFSVVTGADNFTTKRMDVLANGDIRFYEDTGTTPKFYWDSSTERLGLGTSSPNRTLHVAGSSTFESTTGNGAMLFVPNDSVNRIYSRAGNASTTPLDLAFNIGSSEAMRVTSTGIDVTGTATMDGLTVGNSVAPIVTLEETGVGTFHQVVDSNAFSIRNNSLAVNSLKINSNNSVQFFEDTGTTAKFHWDASAEALGIGHSNPSYKLDVRDSSSFLLFASTDATTGSLARIRANGGSTEVLEVQASGNVGIGTASPDQELHVSASATPVIRIESKNNSLGVNESIGSLEFEKLDASGGGAGVASSINCLTTDLGGAVALSFQTGSSSGNNVERMRITSDGKVGIGTDSPSGKFDVVMGTGNRLLFTTTGSDTFVSSVNEANAAYSNLFINGAVTKLGSGGTEACRIDSSQNLLVGKTSTSLGTAGIVGYGAGLLRSTRSGDIALELNRTTSNGEIANFKKDGTTVGGIGTNSGNLYIGNGNTTMVFSDTGNAIVPRGSAGVVRDSAIGLGNSSNRFKDGHFSGNINAATFTATDGIYLGGNGFANKLDDYEEGTWTPVYSPTIGSFTTMTMDVVSATYTKIGDSVFVRAYIRTDDVDVTGASGSVIISGLPFASDSSSSVTVSYTDGWQQAPLAGYASGSAIYLLERSSVSSDVSNSNVGDLTDGTNANSNVLVISGTYRTTA